MIFELLFNLIGTSVIFNVFARRRAARRRKLYNDGGTVSFVGFAGGSMAPADIQEAGRSSKFVASSKELWIETKWPLTPGRKAIPMPVDSGSITFADSGRRKLWYRTPAAQYQSAGGVIELYCQYVDLELLRQILCRAASNTLPAP